MEMMQINVIFMESVIISVSPANYNGYFEGESNVTFSFKLNWYLIDLCKTDSFSQLQSLIDEKIQGQFQSFL
jgi:hypothetical protein